MPEEPSTLDPTGESHPLGLPHLGAWPMQVGEGTHTAEDVQGMEASKGEIDRHKGACGRKEVVTEFRAIFDTLDY